MSYRGEIFHLGHIELICGSMFSGKSEELIRRLRRAQIAKQRVQIFKPALDKRSKDEEYIVSHSDLKIKAIVISNAEEILSIVDDRTEVVGIDEVQFFDEKIVDVCNKLANMGKRVIAAGLDQDFRGIPFEPVPKLMAISEYVTKTLAICARCGAPANRSQRLIPSEEKIVVGAEKVYEARCRHCFEPDLTKQLSLELENTKEEKNDKK